MRVTAKVWRNDIRQGLRPPSLLAPLVAEVCTRLQAQSPPPRPDPQWAPVWERFPLLAIVNGSTREARRHKTAVLRPREGLVWGGKMMVMVEAFGHHPR
jgi:hypothetical protein